MKKVAFHKFLKQIRETHFKSNAEMSRALDVSHQFLVDTLNGGYPSKYFLSALNRYLLAKEGTEEDFGVYVHSNKTRDLR